MKEAAASVKKQAFSSPPLAAQCVRLSGSRALGDTIASIVAQRQPEEVTLLVFDFDKTLTNGHASPTSSLEQRVRAIGCPRLPRRVAAHEALEGCDIEPWLSSCRAVEALSRLRRAAVEA